MRVIPLNLKRRSYKIIVGRGALKHIGMYLAGLNVGHDAYVITNAHLKSRYGSLLSRRLKAAGSTVRFKVVPDSEQSKSIKIVSSVIEDLSSYDIKKKICIYALGGGVIGDLSGFVASVYKRGVPYIQVPTTLLAQVDSAIGGKTAVDLLQGKNLMGSFYQPRLVLSDIDLLRSLSIRQIRNGLAEIIKYAAIKDTRLFSFLESRYAEVLALKRDALEYVVSRCSRIKADIVKEDEREEKGIRTVLNFGHTVGHALEAASGYQYAHGEAVALGMLVAADISVRMGILKEGTAARLEGLLRKAGLPQKIRKIPVMKIIQAHYRDKKFIGSTNKLVLLTGIGRAKIISGVPLKLIKETLKKRLYPRTN